MDYYTDRQIRRQLNRKNQQANVINNGSGIVANAENIVQYEKKKARRRTKRKVKNYYLFSSLF